MPPVLATLVANFWTLYRGTLFCTSLMADWRPRGSRTPGWAEARPMCRARKSASRNDPASRGHAGGGLFACLACPASHISSQTGSSGEACAHETGLAQAACVPGSGRVLVSHRCSGQRSKACLEDVVSLWYFSEVGWLESPAFGRTKSWHALSLRPACAQALNYKSLHEIKQLDFTARPASVFLAGLP